jgi:hypothetical protein
VDLETLSGRLAELANAGGSVWYYRESADQEPHPRATEVMQLVVINGLPIALSTRPDFADLVRADGTTQRR